MVFPWQEGCAVSPPQEAEETRQAINRDSGPLNPQV